MKKNYSLKLRAVIGLCLYFICNVSFGQTATVFNEDFTTPNASNYTIVNGPISGSTNWTMSRSGADFGSGISGGRLVVSNDGSASSNSSGWILGATSSTNFLAPYTTTLANNPGPVTWTFNMRQSRTNPSGFATSGYGTAFILAGTSGSTNVTGTGYAIILGNSGTTVDPIRLVRYSSGIRNFTSMIASNTSGLADFGT